MPMQRIAPYEVLRARLGQDGHGLPPPDLFRAALNAHHVRVAHPDFDEEGDAVMRDAMGGRAAKAGRVPQSAWMQLVMKTHLKATRDAVKKRGKKPLLKDTLQKASAKWRAMKK
jgi:hypothetical protein